MVGVAVALLPIFLIQEELSSGKLVRALNLPMESVERYYLVWPHERSTRPPLLQIVDLEKIGMPVWVVIQTRATSGARVATDQTNLDPRA